MLAIIDSRSSSTAIEELKNHVNDVFLFEANGITSDDISCHPDIFIYQDENNLVISPNAPIELFDFLSMHKINFIIGKRNVGNSFESSVYYNCISTNSLFLHKSGFTDETIIEINKNKKFINIPQAFTRCSLTHIGNNNFITSDKGIEKVLIANNINCFYFSPNEIKIKNHKHGFFGGTNGIVENKIFFNGNIDLHSDGEKLINHLIKSGFDIISLNNDFLYDGGGILFM